jgi:hypothetical protein
MKTTTLLCAVALGSLFVAGCEDNRALGTERTAPERAAPGPNDYPAANRPFDTEPHSHMQSTPATKDMTPDEQPSETSTRTSQPSPNQDQTAGANPRSTAVMNGEDLATIPDLHGPIWGSSTVTSPSPTQPGRTYNGVNIDSRDQSGLTHQNPSYNGVPVTGPTNDRNSTMNSNKTNGNDNDANKNMTGQERQEPTPTAPR